MPMTTHIEAIAAVDSSKGVALGFWLLIRGFEPEASGQVTR
jgi:hypothetical protein